MIRTLTQRAYRAVEAKGEGVICVVPAPGKVVSSVVIVHMGNLGP